MCAEIDEAAIGLPDGIRRKTQRPPAPADGRGASGRVLEVWVDQTGAPSDGIRSLALAAAQAPGWPDDAVPTALMIAQLTLDRIVEHLAPHWLAIAEIADADEQIRAVRAQSAQWYRETGDEQLADYVLYRTGEILLARKHLRAMDGEWEPGGAATRRSATPARSPNAAASCSRRSNLRVRRPCSRGVRSRLPITCSRRTPASVDAATGRSRVAPSPFARVQVRCHHRYLTHEDPFGDGGYARVEPSGDLRALTPHCPGKA
jgi:hypothetical protein